MITTNDSWVSGDNLWHAGFTLSALPLVGLMSGLVRVLDVVWNSKDNTVHFIVERQALGLFAGGQLMGQPLLRHRLSRQPLMAEFQLPPGTSLCKREDALLC